MQDLITIKRVSKGTGVSECAIKGNVEILLEVLEVEARVEVLEFMVFCKELRHRRVEENEDDGEEME